MTLDHSALSIDAWRFSSYAQDIFDQVLASTGENLRNLISEMPIEPETRDKLYRLTMTQEQIRPDVVIAVRFALASLPEQSRMLDTVPGARYDGIPWRSRPVFVPPWEVLASGQLHGLTCAAQLAGLLQ